MRFCGHKRDPLEKKVDMKRILVNELRNIAGITRRLCILIIFHTRFRVNLHFVVARMSRKFLLETETILKFILNTAGFDHTTTKFVNEHSTI